MSNRYGCKYLNEYVRGNSTAIVCNTQDRTKHGRVSLYVGTCIAFPAGKNMFPNVLTPTSPFTTHKHATHATHATPYISTTTNSAFSAFAAFKTWPATESFSPNGR